MDDPTAPKEASRRALEHKLDSLMALSTAIHADPELCFEEHSASSLLCDLLQDSGMKVQRGLCDLPTAFVATTGSGPLSIAFCAEYDALAGVGHACGHNLIAAMSAGAGIALARLADDLGLRVSVIGTPAEEGGGGKVMLLERGAFDAIHASMMVHPWHQDRLLPRCLAVDHLEIHFSGQNAHASAAPHKGVNAADAIVVSEVAIALLRQQLPPGDQVHGIVTKGGDAPNVIPDDTRAHFMIRSSTIESLRALRPRVERCFEAGAIASGCEVDITELSPTYSHMQSDEMLLATWRANAESLGRDFSSDDAGSPLPTFSTDMANVSLAMPSIHPMLGVDSNGAVIHEPAFAQAVIGPSARKAVHDGALSLAWTAIDAASEPRLRSHLLDSAQRHNR